VGRAVAALPADEFDRVGRAMQLAVEAAREAGLAEARHLTTFEDTVATCSSGSRPGDVVLVKGSRGMRMERVVDALVARLARSSERADSNEDGGMLYHFLVPLAKDHIVFNVFRYLTFRSFMALISALVISLRGRAVADRAGCGGCSTAADTCARTRRSAIAARRARRRWAASSSCRHPGLHAPVGESRATATSGSSMLAIAASG
jgi:hypothetical protein